MLRLPFTICGFEDRKTARTPKSSKEGSRGVPNHLPHTRRRSLPGKKVKVCPIHNLEFHWNRRLWSKQTGKWRTNLDNACLTNLPQEWATKSRENYEGKQQLDKVKKDFPISSWVTLIN